MMKIGLIQPDTLRQKVEDTVRRAIMSGLYLPGERLIERELCEDLGVSRASVREALRRLEAEKLVEIIPYKGPIVATISREEARQIYALRAVLEGYAAREFALKASDAMIEEFSQAAQELGRAAQKNSREEVLQAKSRLYDTMLGNCGNELVWEVLRGLYSRINMLRATSPMNPDRLPKSLAEIDTLVQAFRSRDADKAQETASMHVMNACEVALRNLESKAGLTGRESS
ncbi:GntR family transcriptional regulator [Halomonas daqingensis]|uniref:GntR family transcriptional regulator n=2 Tax=Billgrantia desiderata TaxID=52021 RepID=A0ABS9BAS5_9GAMM|nr:GntR family transcriptional regulator [Halomonas desiderata]MCE8048972.1 GntR family transcriptional regulator [Halomonas desiderata]